MSANLAQSTDADSSMKAVRVGLKVFRSTRVHVSTSWIHLFKQRCSLWAGAAYIRHTRYLQTSDFRPRFTTPVWWLHIVMFNQSSIIWLDRPIFDHQLDGRFDGQLVANWQWKKRLLKWSPIKSQSWSEINLIGHQICMDKQDLRHSKLFTALLQFFEKCIISFLRLSSNIFRLNFSYVWLITVKNCSFLTLIFSKN